MEIGDVHKKIEEIANDLVKCKLNCEGIANDSIGIIPRCLLLEQKGNEKVGCIVVGMNPGSSKPKEQNYYKSHFPVNYKTLEECFHELKIDNAPYYSKTRKLIRQLDIGGSIIWTDMCKCEDKEKHKMPPIQTFRTCIGRFLERELEPFPDITIIALGDYAFNYVCLRYPKRLLVGVPHPSAHGGQFDQLFDLNGVLKNKYKEMFRQLKEGKVSTNCIRMFPKVSYGRIK